MYIPSHTPISAKGCTNHMHDFLLGVLQHTAFILNLTENLTCLKFHSRKLFVI